ncbi:hypothetical protein OESDEN_15104 [Oesophagostomum dentatum]|uniref:Uncharacterized protein n=1 Tax=Oesophagostomum dentatum TaxID=61180 RepID=A0A0B1SJU4_OESDE|nr:hypothetical protein OESDEN_15104 [Oesophagostomum dentatum]
MDSKRDQTQSKSKDTKSGSKSKRKVSTYVSESYNRVEKVKLTSPTTNDKTKPILKSTRKKNPILNPQVHEVLTSVEDKILDGKLVRIEKQEEQAMKTAYNERIEEIKQ